MNGKAMVCAMAGMIASMAGSAAADDAASQKASAEPGKILIAVYSWGGNTLQIAEKIHQATGGTLFEIKAATPYSEDYSTCLKEAKRDIDSGARPALAADVADFGKYDVIFVGSPNWYGTFAPPLATFLASHDFSGKTVIPFFSNGGGGMQRCEQDVRKFFAATRDCTVARAITFSFGNATGMAEWLDAVIDVRPASPVSPPSPGANALTAKETALAKAAAFASVGNLAGLKTALIAGFDTGVTVNEFKEVLVQLYAYRGFPRSLNALGTLMALETERGDKDSVGKEPGPMPAGKSLDFGTANQTKLCGAPVKGALFDFAPAIDEYLKAHLFGDIFARDNLDWRTREIATVAMLAPVPGLEPQLAAHIGIAKHNGVTDAQITEILALVRGEVLGGPNTSAFAFGEPNVAYAKYFSGQSFLARLTRDERLNVPVSNVTFEPGCRNNWHKHTGGQLLITVGGVGYYQERGEPARRLVPGDVVEIPPDVEHWHGAAPDRWFAHLSIACNPASNQNTWLEPVSDADYAAATGGAAPAKPEAWDKTFPQSEKVTHGKVQFHNRYGITLTADLYAPKSVQGKLPAIAVCGPFGAVKEQAAGLYAQTLAERGFLTLAFDPSFTGESGGQPRFVASPDINTEDFCAAVDYLSARDDVDAGRIGILGICGWGGMALNAAAIDPRIKATVASTMYDMSRVNANGYFDAMTAADRHALRERLGAQRLRDYQNGSYELGGGVPDVLPDDAPQFLKDYHAYYKTPRGYHPRSLNSNGGWNKTSALSFINMPLLSYIGEIRNPVLVIHGEKAHSRYFSEDAFKCLTGDNKELLIIPGASHVDLYDQMDIIPFDKIADFFTKAF